MADQNPSRKYHLQNQNQVQQNQQQSMAQPLHQSQAIMPTKEQYERFIAQNNLTQGNLPQLTDSMGSQNQSANPMQNIQQSIIGAQIGEMKQTMTQDLGNANSLFHKLYPNFGNLPADVAPMDQQFNLLALNSQHQEQLQSNELDPKIQGDLQKRSQGLPTQMSKNFLTPTKDSRGYEPQSIYSANHEYQMDQINDNLNLGPKQQMVSLIPKELQNQKIPQTQKVHPGLRKISEAQDDKGGHVIYLDEQNNQLSEILEPFESQSIIDPGHEKLIGNLLHEEEDFSSSDNKYPTNFQQADYERGRSNEDNISDLEIKRLQIDAKRNNSFDRFNIAQKNGQRQGHHHQNQEQSYNDQQYHQQKELNQEQINYDLNQNGKTQGLNQIYFGEQRQQENHTSMMPQKMHSQNMPFMDNNQMQQKLQYDNQMIMNKLDMNQQKQQYLQNLQIPSNINVSLPQQTNTNNTPHNFGQDVVNQGGQYTNQQYRGNYDQVSYPHQNNFKGQYQPTYEELQAILQHNNYLQQQNAIVMQKMQMANQGMFNKGEGGIKAFALDGQSHPSQTQNQPARSYNNHKIQPTQQMSSISQSVEILNQHEKNSSHSNPTNQQKKKKQKQHFSKGPRSQQANNNSKPQLEDDYYTEDHQDIYYKSGRHGGQSDQQEQIQRQLEFNEINAYSNESKPNTRSTIGKNNKYNKRTTDSSHKFQSKKRGSFYNDNSSIYDNNGSGQGSYADRKVGSGGNSGKSRDTYQGNHSHNSGQSYDEWIHQIQHEMKLANEDPDKEFAVLDGNIYKLATKKVGSRFLQEHLQKSKQSLINKIIDQIDDSLPDLMTDNYGNFFCSVLIRYLQTHQRYHFLQQIKGQKFYEISCNNRGTWALQTIIEAVTQEEEYQTIKENLLEHNNICRLAMDREGEHIIQKIITTFPEEKRDYLFEVICQNFQKLATDKQGLCVMKKLIECTKNQESQKIIVQKINLNPLLYVQNEFGNFVVSEVLNQFDYKINKEIFEKMKGNFVKLSQNKYSSKFIEICIDKAPSNVQNEIFSEFCESAQLYRVVLSNFGNYVLQKSLNSYGKSDVQKMKLLRAIIECLGEVNDFKVQLKWGNELLKQFINDLSANSDQKQELSCLLSSQMDRINSKHKSFKQGQMNQHLEPPISPYQDHYGKGSSNNSSNNSGSGYNRDNQHYEKKGPHQQQAGKGWFQSQENDQFSEGYFNSQTGMSRGRGGKINHGRSFKGNKTKVVYKKEEILWNPAQANMESIGRGNDKN